MVSRSGGKLTTSPGFKPPAVRVDKKAIEDNKFLDPAMSCGREAAPGSKRIRKLPIPVSASKRSGSQLKPLMGVP
jgi:hypothetical protein